MIEEYYLHYQKRSSGSYTIRIPLKTALRADEKLAKLISRLTNRNVRCEDDRFVLTLVTDHLDKTEVEQIYSQVLSTLAQIEQVIAIMDAMR